MKTKIIIVLALIIVVVITGVVYYIKNVLTAYDKDGMIYNPDNYTQLDDSDNFREGDA